MKSESNISKLYLQAKKEWDSAPNDTDSSKTNEEYFDGERKEFYDEVFARVKEHSDKEFKEKQKTFYICADCGEEAGEVSRFDHEFRHAMHPPMKVMVKINLSKVLPVVLFFGFLIFLVWSLMARNDNTPDLNVPDNGQVEDICPNGYPC